MKKRVGFILLAVVVAAAAAVLYLQSKKTADIISFAEYLPADTLATVSVSHLNRISGEFGGSPLGKLLAKETMADILGDLRAPVRDIHEYNQVYDDIASVMNHPAFRAVFGDDVSLGLLRPDLQAFGRDPERELRRVMLLFAGTSVSGALDEFARLVVSDQVSEETIDGVPLTRIVLDEQAVIYGYAEDGKVLLAYDPHTISKGLAVRKSKTGLDAAAPFEQAAGFWQSFDEQQVLLKVYFNPQILRELFAASNKPELEEAAAYLSGVRFFASVAGEQGEELYSESRAGFSSEELHELVKAAIAAQPEANTTLHMLRKKYLAYDWASTLAPEVLMHSMGTVGKSEIQQADRLLQRELGITLDAFFQAFGPQYGFVVSRIENGGFIPIPKLIGFVEVRDHAVAGNLFDTVRQKIADTGLAEEQQLEVNGETIRYWTVLPGEATQPAMVLTEDMLYLANGKSSLAQVLRAEDPQHLLNPKVAELLGGPAGSAVENARFGAFVIYPARLADEVGEVAQWVMNTVSAARGVSVDRLGSEILELMRAYEVLTTTSSLNQEYGEWRVFLKKKAADGDR